MPADHVERRLPRDLELEGHLVLGALLELERAGEPVLVDAHHRVVLAVT
jgi:hypothetical protein